MKQRSVALQRHSKIVQSPTHRLHHSQNPNGIIHIAQVYLEAVHRSDSNDRQRSEKSKGHGLDRLSASCLKSSRDPRDRVFRISIREFSSRMHQNARLSDSKAALDEHLHESRRAGRREVVQRAAAVVLLAWCVPARQHTSRCARLFRETESAVSSPERPPQQNLISSEPSSGPDPFRFESQQTFNASAKHEFLQGAARRRYSGPRRTRARAE